MDKRIFDEVVEDLKKQFPKEDGFVDFPVKEGNESNYQVKTYKKHIGIIMSSNYVFDVYIDDDNNVVVETEKA